MCKGISIESTSTNIEATDQTSICVLGNTLATCHIAQDAVPNSKYNKTRGTMNWTEDIQH